MTDTILIINGPNLDMLGTRQPEVYGHDTLDDVEALCRRTAEDEGVEIDFRQSDSEAEIMKWIKEARGTRAGILINPAGFTSTSIAILDSLLIFDAVGGWEIDDSTKLSVGINNLTNEEPPYAFNIGANALVGVHGSAVVGRYYFARITKRF